MKNWPKIEVPSSGNKSEYGWCMYHVYAKTGNFVVTGFLPEVKEWMNNFSKTVTNKWFANRSLYKDGKCRYSSWIGSNFSIFTPKREKYYLNSFRETSYIVRRKFKFYNSITTKAISFKRLPKRWVDEMDEIFTPHLEIDVPNIVDVPNKLFNLYGVKVKNNIVPLHHLELDKNIQIAFGENGNNDISFQLTDKAVDAIEQFINISLSEQERKQYLFMKN